MAEPTPIEYVVIRHNYWPLEVNRAVSSTVFIMENYDRSYQIVPCLCLLVLVLKAVRSFRCFFVFLLWFPSVLVPDTDLFSLKRLMTIDQRYSTVAFTHIEKWQLGLATGPFEPSMSCYNGFKRKVCKSMTTLSLSTGGIGLKMLPFRPAVTAYLCIPTPQYQTSDPILTMLYRLSVITIEDLMNRKNKKRFDKIIIFLMVLWDLNFCLCKVLK